MNLCIVIHSWVLKAAENELFTAYNFYICTASSVNITVSCVTHIVVCFLTYYRFKNLYLKLANCFFLKGGRFTHKWVGSMSHPWIDVASQERC